MDRKIFVTCDISCKDNIATQFLYNSLMGRILLRLIIKPVFSKFIGVLMDNRISKILIPFFIENYNICMDENKYTKYKSLNNFFTRKIKEGSRPITANSFDVIAPCDGKLTAYAITSDCTFKIKNIIYTIDGLLQDKTLANEFMDGICLIFRLTPADYHRYVYIDNGECLYRKKINGVLHTVRSISQQRYEIFIQNVREYEVMQTEYFNKVIQVEVGALFVGRISNHDTGGTFKRGDEKGMFEFGGSTIVMLFQKNVIRPDDSIFENTRQNKETVVKMGEKIGEKTHE